MRHHSRSVVYAALIAAMYAALTHLQNLLLPGSATWAVQFRVSEALCVLAFFTPAAIPGLTIGCFLFNLTYGGSLPLDILIGSTATAIACTLMYLTRRFRLFGVPVFGLTMPALWNALLVGWELSVYIGGGFAINAFYVALGELAVLLTLGLLLYTVMRRNGLARRLFREDSD